MGVLHGRVTSANYLGQIIWGKLLRQITWPAPP
jgi:hypothetical protein